jgi:hypothetical protein
MATVFECIQRLEPIKQLILYHLYGISYPIKDATILEINSSLKKSITESTKEVFTPMSYQDLACILTEVASPKEKLKFCTDHKNEILYFSISDIQRLEREALRDLAHGNTNKNGSIKKNSNLEPKFENKLINDSDKVVKLNPLKRKKNRKKNLDLDELLKT